MLTTGGPWEQGTISRGRLAILESPPRVHLITKRSSTNTRINKDSVRLIKVTLTLVKHDIPRGPPRPRGSQTAPTYSFVYSLTTD